MNLTGTYRDILRSELEARCQRKPRYSLRAFARDLGISAPRLHNILTGKYGLSRETAEQIAKRLGLSSHERAHFADLVESEHARSRVRRAAAKARLEASGGAYINLGLEAFQVISDWYHLAVLELTKVENFESEPNWIAKQLGITIHEARGALERLKKLEMIEDSNGVIKAVASYFANAAGVPSEAAPKFHRQFLAKASEALTFQDVNERDFSALVLAIDEKDLPEAKKFIKKFRDQFDSKFAPNGTGKKTRVYGLGIQLFSLQERNPK